MVFYFTENNLGEHSQHCSYLESIYFSLVSLLEIGYGDYAVDVPGGKAFFFMWSLMAVPAVTVLVKTVVDVVSSPCILQKKDFIEIKLTQVDWRRTKEDVKKATCADTASLLHANFHYYYCGRVRETALPVNMKLGIEISKSRCKCSDVFAFVH